MCLAFFGMYIGCPIPQGPHGPPWKPENHLFEKGNHLNQTLIFNRGKKTSLKLTFSPLKMDGWNTIVSFWDGPSSGVMLVSGRITDGFFPSILDSPVYTQTNMKMFEFSFFPSKTGEKCPLKSFGVPIFRITPMTIGIVCSWWRLTRWILEFSWIFDRTYVVIAWYTKNEIKV